MLPSSVLGVDASVNDRLTCAHGLLVRRAVLRVLDAQLIAPFAAGVYKVFFGHRAERLQSSTQATDHSAPGMDPRVALKTGARCRNKREAELLMVCLVALGKPHAYPGL